MAVGVYHDGEEHYAYHGVTSTENPLPVDASTLFRLGSITKTYTATAIMRLVDDARVDFTAPARRYVSELRLQDRAAAEQVTVVQLLNHTAGWAGDFFTDTGDGDDALARHVAELATAAQIAPPGTIASYNNAAFGVAGRLIEKLTGATYESAMRDLVLTHLELRNSWFFAGDVITRRFAVGHELHEGAIRVARDWKVPRRAHPAGGLVATASDLLAYARVHLGNGVARVLERATLERMRHPTIAAGGGALGDYVGIAWLLRDFGGIRLVGHEGIAAGQLAALQLVPERDFAIAILTNARWGGRLHRRVLGWALERYLGVAPPEPRPRRGPDLQPFCGEYESPQMAATVMPVDERLRVSARVRERALPLPPFSIALVSDDGFVVADGPDEGAVGRFVRENTGEVRWIELDGRLLARRSR